jgi:hypothetical protein
LARCRSGAGFMTNDQIVSESALTESLVTFGIIDFKSMHDAIDGNQRRNLKNNKCYVVTYLPT